MKNVVQRLLLFFIFMPGLIALILLLPQYNHLALNIIILLCGLGLSFESALIVGLFPNPLDSTNFDKVCRIAGIVFIGAAAPVSIFLVSIGVLKISYLLMITTVLVIGIFTVQVFRTQWVPFEETLPLVLGYVFVLFYPGAGLAFLSAMTILPLPQADISVLLLVFLGSVFMNDSAAYAFGYVFGKNSARPVKISPNKTVIGFIGGFSFSILVNVLAAIFWPSLYPSGPYSAVFIGALTGVLVIIGDLFESALKRSAHVKDSGTIIPGRGGLLDSMDSLVFAAPIFYFAYLISQHPAILSL